MEKITSKEYQELKFQIGPKMKYRNEKCEVDGEKFDSKKEMQYYLKLKQLLKAGEIVGLELQPKYDLLVNGTKCGFYKADFKVFWKSGLIQVVDVKGMRTPVYQLKKKLIKAIYGITIKEV